MRFGIKPDLVPQERKLILENRTFDPAVSEKQLQGKVLPLIRDMLGNRCGIVTFCSNLSGSQITLNVTFEGQSG